MVPLIYCPLADDRQPAIYSTSWKAVAIETGNDIPIIGKAPNECVLPKDGMGVADLISLAIFAKVVEAKGVSEAARRLNMPVSTVSRRIAELEDQLSVRLLERSTRNLRLTDIGTEVLEHAQRIVELSETVDNLVSNQLSAVAGVLRLSAPRNTAC